MKFLKNRDIQSVGLYNFETLYLFWKIMDSLTLGKYNLKSRKYFSKLKIPSDSAWSKELKSRFLGGQSNVCHHFFKKLRETVLVTVTIYIYIYIYISCKLVCRGTVNRLLWLQMYLTVPPFKIFSSLDSLNRAVFSGLSRGDIFKRLR